MLRKNEVKNMFSSPEKNSKKLGLEENVDSEKKDTVETLEDNNEVSTFKNNVNSKETVAHNNELRQNLGRTKPDKEKSEAFDWDEGQKRVK